MFDDQTSELFEVLYDTRTLNVSLLDDRLRGFRICSAGSRPAAGGRECRGGCTHFHLTDRHGCARSGRTRRNPRSRGGYIGGTGGHVPRNRPDRTRFTVA